MSLRALLPRPCLPPLWRELAAVRELAAAGGTPRPALGQASGAPVLLIPGFLAGDVSLR